AVVVAVASLATSLELRTTVPFHPQRTTGVFLSELRQVATSSERRRLVAIGTEAVRHQLHPPPRVLALVRGHSVDVGPYETSLAWAYGLDWRPEPLLQQYTALDATLDRFNADQLERSGAARDLRRREWPAGDGKHPLFAAPQTCMALLCSYRALAFRRGWELHGRARG